MQALDMKPIPQQRSQIKSWTFSRASAADQHMLNVLQQRALDKFRYQSLTTLLYEAKEAMQKAGHWRDEVLIDVDIEGGNSVGRCSRLLHGIPSPRFWRVNSVLQQMPAIDIVYFFVANENERSDLLQSAAPNFSDVQSLSDWLATFSSRIFEADLIQALCDVATYLINSTSMEHKGQLLQPPPHSACLTAVSIAAEIDRYAWYRGYRSVNLAKAAPVWCARYDGSD